jgi:hypothetical protein
MEMEPVEKASMGEHLPTKILMSYMVVLEPYPWRK